MEENVKSIANGMQEPDKAQVKGKDKDKHPNARTAKRNSELGGVEDETVECKGSSFIVWDRTKARTRRTSEVWLSPRNKRSNLHCRAQL